MRRFLILLAILGCAASTSMAQAPIVPPGFEVVEFADAKLANDIICMTIDPKGRVVVSGRGYIRILVDDDRDGKADRALDFAAEPKDGAMGLLWEGDTLYATGDGGLRRFTSSSGDKADGPSALIRKMKTGGEHSAHAIRRGPDGWLYVLCGNNTGIDKSYADLPTSPIKEPTAGCVLRFQPDLKKCEIVAHGFRNPYSMDFNPDGDLFTYDSDNERCINLPWYEPTRFYHVIEGRHYGWLNPQHAAFWRRPPYFVDVVAPLATLGRGSPTGVACYRHNQFPPEYHGGFFLCDWTFGKVHYARLERKGATYHAQTHVFLQSKGDHGFAPSACAVDESTGDLYVSIGGRGTRGAVYRIRHLERYKTQRNRLTPLKVAPRSLQWNDAVNKEYEAKLHARSDRDHLRALQIARRQSSFLGEKGVSSPFANRHYFDDLSVRCAYADLIDDLLRGAAPRHLEAFKQALKNNVELAQVTSFALGIARSDPAVARESGLHLLTASKLASRRLEGIRLVQIGMGDIGAKNTIGTLWEGYSPRVAFTDAVLAGRLAPMFPSGDADLDRELARTLGMLGMAGAELRMRLLARASTDSSPQDDIHYLACLARLPGQRSAKETTLTAAALLDLDRKMADRKLKRESNWPLRVRELVAGLFAKDAALYEAMVAYPAFGRPEHAQLATVEGFPRERAARIFLERWRKEKDFSPTGAVVPLLESLPADEVAPLVRKNWGLTGVDAALLPILARTPEPGDRVRFLAGLNSPQASILEACVHGLTKLGGTADGEEIFALIRALHRSSDKQTGLRKTLAGRLEQATNQKMGTNSKQWIAWMEKAHPDLGKRLANPDGVDVARWSSRLAGLDWNAGNIAAGKKVYTRTGCVNCHSGSQAVGPDLAGVASRFSRADLFTAILQPSRDVSARYQMTLVETREGKTYQGVVIYDAVDSLILQTTQSGTVRLDGAQIASRAASPQSLMPAGLLDGLTDRDVVDLYAYLKSLAP